MKRPFLGSRMSTAVATATRKAATARPRGAARQLMPWDLKAYDRLPASTTATASPVKMKACPRLQRPETPHVLAGLARLTATNML